MENGMLFEPRMSVMRVRATFIAPYRKAPFLYVEKMHLKTKRDFKGRIKTVASSWPAGTYYLKLSSGKVFCRFDITNGKVTKIYKESPATGRNYPIWVWWKR